MSDDREQRIRDRAYAIWMAEGRPDGCDAAHWTRAAAEIDVAAMAGAAGIAEAAPALSPKRVARPRKTLADSVIDDTSGKRLKAAGAAPASKTASKRRTTKAS